jgi:protein gp37
MAENTKIEWSDHAFNLRYGCQHISPGCDHCYAETMMDTRFGRVQGGPHGERERNSLRRIVESLALDRGRKPRELNSLGEILRNGEVRP